MEVPAEKWPRLVHLMELHREIGHFEPRSLVDHISGLKEPLSDNGSISAGIPGGGFLLEGLWSTDFGPHEGEFAVELGEGTTLVLGPNGSGKTHIVLALRWCLFGSALGEGRGGGPEEATTYLNWNRAGSRDPRMSVTAAFRWGDVRYTAERQLRNGRIRFTLTDRDSGKVSEALPPDLTPSVLNLMVFSGETLTFLWSGDPFSGEGPMMSAVSILSGGRELEVINGTLEGAREYLLTKMGGISSADTDELGTWEMARARIDSLNEELERSERELSSALEERKRRSSSYEEALRLLSREAPLEEALKTRIERASALPYLQERVKSVLSSLSVGLLRGMGEEALRDVVRERKQRVNNRIMMGGVDAQAAIVREVMDRKRCLCGTPIGRTGSGRKRLEVFLEGLMEKRKELDRLGPDMPWTSDPVVEDCTALLSSEFVKRDGFDGLMADWKRSLKASRELEDFGDPRVKVKSHIRTLREYEALAGKVKYLQNRIKVTASRKRKAEGELRVQRRKLARAWGRLKDRDGAIRVLEFVESALVELSEARESLEKGVMERIGSLTAGMLPPGGNIKSVEFDPSSLDIFTTVRKDQSKRVPLTSLSAGEKEFVTFIIMAAFSRFSGSRMMADSPFAYMDSEMRSAAIGLLQDLPKGSYLSLADGILDIEEEKRLTTGPREGTGILYRLGKRPEEKSGKGERPPFIPEEKG